MVVATTGCAVASGRDWPRLRYVAHRDLKDDYIGFCQISVSLFGAERVEQICWRTAPGGVIPNLDRNSRLPSNIPAFSRVQRGLRW